MKWNKIHLVFTVNAISLLLAVACGTGGGAPNITTNNPDASVPIITTQPQAVNVPAGGLARFSVTASGIPAPTFAWQSSPDGATWSPIKGATLATCSLPTSDTDIGTRQVRAIATNSLGSATSNAANLMVNPNPTIVTQPQDQELIAGSMASFSVAVSGDASPMTYDWQSSPDGSTWTAILGTHEVTYSFLTQAAVGRG